MRTTKIGGAAIAAAGLLLVIAGCSSKKYNAGDAGPDAGSDAGGKGGNGGKGGAGGTGGASAITDGGAMLPMMMLTCTETPPTTPVTCGGEVCQAPTEFAMNPCIIPCCVTQGGKEMCGSKSSAAMFSTECTLPAKADPHCPDIMGMGMGTGTPFAGCCSAQNTCGFISTLRPGCITSSPVVMLPMPPLSCTDGADDGGTGSDGG
jgi:hypothetical protein